MKLLVPIHLGTEAELAGVTAGDIVRFECVIQGARAAKRYKLALRAFDMAGGAGGGEAEFAAGEAGGGSGNGEASLRNRAVPES